MWPAWDILLLELWYICAVTSPH